LGLSEKEMVWISEEETAKKVAKDLLGGSQIGQQNTEGGKVITGSTNLIIKKEGQDGTGKKKETSQRTKINQGMR